MSVTIDGNLGIDKVAPGGVEASDLNMDIGSLSFRNKIINGNFDIWQRSTSQTTSGYGSDDRYNNSHIGSTKTNSRQEFTVGQTDVPGNPRYFSRTVVSSVAGAANYVLKGHAIENVKTFAGKTATLSFYAKADSTKNISIELYQHFGTGGSPSKLVAGIGVNKIQLTTSWQRFEFTIQIPSITGKTIGTSGGDHLNVGFWFDAGSNYNARTASLGQQSGTFDIAQVQLEEGSVATPFEDRPIGLELELCQRYLFAITAKTSQHILGIGYNVSAEVARFYINFPINMRIAPTSTLTGTIGTYDGAILAEASSIYEYVSTDTVAQISIEVSVTQFHPAVFFIKTTGEKLVFQAEL